MAKASKFPSPANKKPGTKANEKKIETVEEKTVEGKKQNLISVHYTKDNHHILDGVHALRKGNNSIPKEAFIEHMKHPSTQQLIKDGHIILNEEDFEEESEVKARDLDGGDDSNMPDDGNGGDDEDNEDLNPDKAESK